MPDFERLTDRLRVDVATTPEEREWPFGRLSRQLSGGAAVRLSARLGVTRNKQKGQQRGMT